jgi:glycosyltransferase involved in cell wall biosynthesis
MGASVEAPYVSVIIPTLHREEPLRRVLTYFLESETYSPFEVIVVDQSDRHEPATREYLAAVSARIRLLQIERKGAANARNCGARMAEGSLLLFADDDDLPQAEFIRGHVEAHRDPQIAAVCGAMLHPGRQLRTEAELSPEEVTSIQHQGGPRDVDCFFECSWGSTCNLSVKTEWFWKVGGFYSNENAGVASGGLHDALFGQSLRQHGGRILYSPHPVVVRGRAPTGGCRDLPDSAHRRILEIENALDFWMRTRNSRLRAISITLRRLVVRRSIPQTTRNLWLFVNALARWVRSSKLA